jgi:uncharacterized membrane protein YgcG
MSPMMMGGPFSGLYQVLFGVQNVVFSLGQAVQLVGMNQQALQQALDSAWSMMDHAIATFHELRALEAKEKKHETKEDKKKRQRLKALRWALVMGTSWVVYKLIRRITSSSRRRRLRHNGASSTNAIMPNNNYSPSYSYGTGGYGSSMYGPSMNGGGYNSSSPYGSSLFGGGGYGGGGYF